MDERQIEELRKAEEEYRAEEAQKMKRAPQQPVVVPLIEPIEAHGEQLHELEIRPPRAEDLEILDDDRLGTSARSLKLIVRLSGIPMPVAKKLSLPDYAAASKAINDFFDVPGLIEEPGESEE